jgi:epoxide hydrolase-like predicted phosphatase
MIRAIIFDSGGVLTKRDSDDVLFSNIAEAFLVSTKEVLKYLHAFKDFPLQTGKISESEFWKQFAKSANRKLPLGYKKLWTKDYLQHSPKNHEVIEFAMLLKKKGYIVPILSNTIKPHLRLNLKRKMYAGFYPVVLSCNVGLRKPNPKIYSLMLNRIKVKASEAVMVDDKPEYLVGAKKIGIQTVVFKSLPRLKKDLRKLGVVW